MTREEAKALLLNISAYDIDTQRGMKKQEAIEMAIKALDQEPCDKCLYSTSEGCQYDDITETIPPFETSDDAISRQEVLKYIEGSEAELGHSSENELVCQDIKELPPVTPQPEIVRCSQCKYAEVADSEDSQDGYTCQFHRGNIWFSGSYCSWAEKKPQAESKE